MYSVTMRCCRVFSSGLSCHLLFHHVLSPSLPSCIIGNPKLLIADEPTSGLDSFQALQVVQSLKELTRSENIITICSIHQPRSSIWNLFDDVLLMTPTGRIAYHGSADNVLSYFQTIGYPCPATTNAAEHLIDLVSLDVSGEDALQRSRLLIDQIADAFEAIHRNSTIASQYDKLVANQDSSISKPSPGGDNVFFRAYGAIGRSITRFLLLLGRSVKQTTRDVTTNIARLGTSAVLAIVIGSVYGTQSSAIKPDSVANRVNVIALGSVNMAMLSVIKTLQLFKLEQGIINRERSGEQYTALEYLLSKSLAELPFDGLVGAVSKCLHLILRIYSMKSLLLSISYPCLYSIIVLRFNSSLED